MTEKKLPMFRFSPLGQRLANGITTVEKSAPEHLDATHTVVQVAVPKVQSEDKSGFGKFITLSLFVTVASTLGYYTYKTLRDE